MKNKTIKFLFVLCFMIFVTFFSINIIQSYTLSPKKYLVDAITNLKNNYSYLYDFKNSNYDFFKNDFTYEAELKIDTDLSFLDKISFDKNYDNLVNVLKKINDMNTNYVLKKNNDKLLFYLNNDYNNENFKFLYYIDKNDHFIKVNDNDYIKLNSFIDYLKQNLYYFDNYSDLLKIVIECFIKNLDDDYFKKEIEFINIDGKQYKTYKNILTLDKNNIIEIINKVVEELKYNDEFKEFKNFKNFILLNMENYIDDVVLNINTYVYNKKVIRYDFVLSDMTNNYNINKVLISFINNEKIELKINDVVIGYLKLNKSENSNQIILYINDEKILEINKNNLVDKKQIEIKIGNTTNANLNLLLSEVYDENTLEEYDKILDNVVCDISFIGFDLIKIAINNNAKIYFNSSIDLKVDKFKNVEELLVQKST